jgi:RNA polymerase subunit RPABC4/transcription elongation factor Spt4
MSVDELTDRAPHTRNCRACSVEINAASARCPYCGARQFKRQPILGWRGMIICLVAVGLAIFLTRLILESKKSGLEYTVYGSSNLAALIPAGYVDQALTAPHGTAVIGYADPGNPSNAVIISASQPDGGAPRARTLALSRRLANEPGVARGQLAHILFPGGQTAWEQLYTLDKVAYAVIAFDSCSNRIGVTVTLSSPSLTLLGELEEALPRNAAPVCDGPNFSARDRADPAVPLSLPKR